MKPALSRLIEKVYASTGQATEWPGVIEALAEATGARSGCIVALGPDDSCANVNCFHNIDPEWISAYNDYYYRYDPSPELLGSASLRIRVDHVTDPGIADCEEPNRTFYNEVMVPQDFRHTLALGLSGTESVNAALILQRSARQGPFEAEAVKTLERLCGHLRQGLELHSRLHRINALQSSMAGALDNAPVGVLLLDTRGRPTFVNRRARDILETTDALSISTDELTALHPSRHKELQSLVHRAMHATGEPDMPQGNGLTLASTDGQSSINVQVTPLGTAEPVDPLFGHSTMVAVWLTPLNTAYSPPARILRDLYGLSAAEAELLSMLVQGNSVSEIADLRRVSIETIRSQLKRLMSKMEVSRQADLVRLVLSGPALAEPG